MPAGAVKKIKFVNKNTVDEYVKPDQKLLAWGGEDSWEYEFVEEEIKAELEPADKIEINGNEASTSEEEEMNSSINVIQIGLFQISWQQLFI